MSAEDEVRTASTAFYSALNRMCNGDAGPLMEVWPHTAEVSTMHPIGGREIGWDQVQGPWQQVAQMSSGGEVKLDEQVVRVSGDMAYETGFERGSLTIAGEKIVINHRVTNIYQRQSGTWRIVHHHTDVSFAMLDLLNRLRAKT